MALPNAEHDALHTFYAALEKALAVNGQAVCHYDGTVVQHLVNVENAGLRVITRDAAGALDEALYPTLASAVLDMAGASVVLPARRRAGGLHR